MAALWIILTACALSGTGAVLGTVMMLRRQTMLADAIAHAVLPGIVLGFWLEGDLNSPLLIAGAGASGLLSVFLIDFFRNYFNLQGDAGTALIFTFLFSVGVLMMSYSRGADLDVDCVLFGEIAFVPLDTATFFGINLGAKAFWTSSIVAITAFCLFEIFFRQIQMLCFDENFCKNIGMRHELWHYCLTGFVAIFSVTAFSSVGLVLVLTFLVLPSASAYLIASRLREMVYKSFAFGIFNAVSGYFLAAETDTSISGAIALVSFLIFLAVILVKKLMTYKNLKTAKEAVSEN
jgi:manganese/zinc/iron transport system permease protein